MSNFCHDVVVVGSRCAGAATALLLARLGHDVALVDRSTFPSDTLSTHAISRAGVVQLHRWGLLDDVLATGAPPVRQVSFVLPGTDRIDRMIKESAGVDVLLAPRRIHLDAVMRDAALSAGATAYTMSVSDVLRNHDGRVVGVQGRSRGGESIAAEARCVVAADGRNSRLADRLGAAVRHRSVSPAGTFYSYVGGLDAEGFEFHLAPRALVGVFPTHDGEACVWISAPADDLQPLLAAGSRKTEFWERLIAASSPSLATRLSGRSIGEIRGAARLPNILRQPAGPGWALVGDAGYHRDPITGHGISDAFRDAELAARAIDTWLTGKAGEETARLGYDRNRSTSVREIFEITRALTGFPGVPRFAELQKQLSRAIDREARSLAAQPTLGRTPVLAA